jgi:hypothetical protein
LARREQRAAPAVGAVSSRVYLHIGEPKSGTTFLQDVLWDNRNALARAGLVLPGLSVNDHFRAAQDLQGHTHAADGSPALWSGEWDVLAAQARGAGQCAVISHELLCAVDEEQAGRAVRSLQPAEVHVVVTVRDLASLLPAEWQETVKHRNTRSWTDWLGDVIDRESGAEDRRRWLFWRVHDTLEILRCWAVHVPAERIHVIPVPPSGSSADELWRRFADVVGIEVPGLAFGAARANASLGAVEAELLRRLNTRLPAERLPQWFYVRAVKDGLAQDLGARADARRITLPAERLAWARAEAARVADGVRSAGFRVAGELDELVPSADPATKAPAKVNDGEVLDAALAGLAAMLERDYRLASRRPGVREVFSSWRDALTHEPRVRELVERLRARLPMLSRLRTAAYRLVLKARG